jgi:hypothetical protein
MSYFEGYYFKHQKNNEAIAFIAGKSDDHSFIQVVTANDSHYFTFPKSEYKKSSIIKIGNCVFSPKGIVIDICEEEITIKGRIRYTDLTPIKYDIMGPFKYFPMECSHGIVSMRHKLHGQLQINEKTLDFTHGVGYIESDSGVSFPKQYLWTQCNFNCDCSVSVSAASIPFAGICFTGCICVVYFNSREYRLSTYLGVKIVLCNERNIILKQGKYLLIVEIEPCAEQEKGQSLPAPSNGKMTRTIIEHLSCPVRMRFYKSGKLLFDLKSNNGSYECAGNV